MITYIDAKNAGQYTKLFDRAATVLKENWASLTDLAGQLDTYNITQENFEINSLNEYYAYLEFILKALDSDATEFLDATDEAKSFLRLPLDEEVLAINADTRTITVPSSFSRYGVGVQGDELAEVLYFTIDRYFDRVDLARNDIQIRIQWEAKDSNKNIIRGITRNFGKEIIYQEANKPLMVFGWPISHELTQTDGTIKFAVRFYTLDENSKFTYSFTTLPAEIKVNASLDYDLSDNTLIEVDNGSSIINRIKSNGIYDVANYEVPNAPLTNEPGIHAVYATGKIIDLPLDDSGVELEFSARPNPSGAISYNWNRFNYNSTTGEYAGSSNPYTDGVETVYKKVEGNITGEALQYQYYQEVTGDGGVKRYQLISLADDFSDENGEYIYDNENEGFMNKQGETVPLYTKVSRATVKTAGIYTVEASSRILINTVPQSPAMTSAEGIKIPGPLKPEVGFPDGNTTLGEQDVYHVIGDEQNPVTLKVIAAAGEAGKDASEVGDNPQVELTYDWKKVIDDVATSIKAEGAAGAMTASLLPIEKLPDDDTWKAITMENGVEKAKGIHNQKNVILVQDGDTITVYQKADLKRWNSTTDSDQNQDGPHEWVAIDIDTGITGFDAHNVTWQGSGLHDTDEGELNTGAGHIVFWLKVDEIRESNEHFITRAIGRDGEIITLKFEFNTSIRFSEDESEITINDLTSAELDETYCVEVKATRNKISTTQMSGNYRITNAPAMPEITFTDPANGTAVYYTNYFEKAYWTVSDNKIYKLAVLPKTRRSNNPTLSFSVNKPVKSDRIIYAWMRLNYNDNTDEPILEPDFNGVDFGESQEQFSAIFAELNETFFSGGAAEYPDYYITGNIENPTNETLEISYRVTQDDVDGYYYCVVINELNGHINVNISPFFLVTTFH